MFKNIVEDIKAVSAPALMVILSNRGFHALVVYRISHQFYKLRLTFLALLLTRIIQILYGIDIDYRAKIDQGCLIVHGVGIVIGKGVHIGKNAKIYHGVTLGISDIGDSDGFPQVGNNVLIGAGAKLLGNITIGDNVKVGANSVVLTSIPANVTVGGIPAKILRSRANY